MTEVNQKVVYQYSNGFGGSITIYAPQNAEQQQNGQTVQQNSNQSTQQQGLTQNTNPYSLYSIQPYQYSRPTANNNGYYSNTYKEDPSKTKGENFNEWSDSVALNNGNSVGNFQIKSDSTKNKTEYLKDLEKFADEYIAMYDADDDGTITFDEFWDQELKNAEEELGELSKEDKKELKKQLKTMFQHLNVTNAGDSKDALTQKEIMNMFLVMDGTNSGSAADGYITRSEYMIATQLLADASTDEESDGSLYQYQLKQSYKKFFLA